MNEHFKQIVNQPFPHSFAGNIANLLYKPKMFYHPDIQNHVIGILCHQFAYNFFEGGGGGWSQNLLEGLYFLSYIVTLCPFY